MTPFLITFCCTGTKPQPWLEGLRLALPQASVEVWQPGATLADYAVVWAPPQSFLDEQTQLKGIFVIGAGVDALLRLRLPSAVPIVRLDDAGMAVQMAEYVSQAVIRYFRELDVYEKDMRDQRWTFHTPRTRRDFAVGIMGLGALGTRVAQTLAQFEFPVNGWSRTPKSLPGVNTYSGAAQFNDFLAVSRVLVNLLPLTASTKGIMNRHSLARLQPGSYVINVGRGAHLVDDDLLALLDSGHLAGATLDVFDTEPLPLTHPYWHHPKLTITPHTSARTMLPDSVAQIAAKISALQRGQRVAGLVDLAQGY